MSPNGHTGARVVRCGYGVFAVASGDGTGLQWRRRQDARVPASSQPAKASDLGSLIREHRPGCIRCRTNREGEIMATRKPRKKKVGTWKIKRVGENQLAITIPDGMTIRSDAPVTVEDLLSGIAN